MAFIKKHIKALCMLLSLAVLSLTVLSDDALLAGFAERIPVQPAYILTAAALAALPLYLEGVMVFYIQRRLMCGVSMARCVGGTMMSRCYGALTPMNAASHPTLLLYLKRHGVSTGKSASISALRYVFFQTALVLSGVTALLLGGGDHGIALTLGVGLGFIVNALPVAVLLTLSLHRRLGVALLDILLKPFRKRGFALKTRFIGQFEAFQTGFRALTYADIGLLLCLALLQVLCLLSIPFVTIAAAGSVSPYFGTVADAALLTLTFTAVPLPGGTGIAENGFLRVFSAYLDAPARVSSLLIWRGATYYLVILLGGLYILAEHVKARRGRKTPHPGLPPEPQR